MKRIISTIILTIGLVFSAAPLASAVGSAAPICGGKNEPPCGGPVCTTNPSAPNGGTPCAPECVPTVNYLNAVIIDLGVRLTGKEALISQLFIKGDAALLTIARKDARIKRLQARIRHLRAANVSR
jgi:hypothetical protein